MHTYRYTHTHTHTHTHTRVCVCIAHRSKSEIPLCISGCLETLVILKNDSLMPDAFGKSPVRLMLKTARYVEDCSLC